MDLLSTKWIINLVVSLFVLGVGCTSVQKKIYINLNDSAPCVRLLNGTHQIGCQSSLSGDVGVLHLLESEANLDWVLRTGPNPPYMVILESPLFTRSIMMKLKNGSSRVAGVVVVAPSTNPPKGFSPHTTCPNENSGVYTESYDADLAHCKAMVWNPLGNGLSYEEYDFPIFSIKDDNDTQVIRQCFLDHNLPVNGSGPQYPLCAMQLSSHMSAVTDTVTCMRRNDIGISLNPEMVCDPLGDQNIWAFTKPLNISEKGHKAGESVVIAAARLDSRSFFFDVAPGADSATSGIVTLLAAANALRNATQEAQLSRNIFYTFFQGETFDYIGSSRMVYDMEEKKFVVDLDNIHSVVEVGQVAHSAGSKLWLHTDPVSRRNSSVNDEVSKLLDNLRTAATGLDLSVDVPGATQPLPPSSFQRFLRARPIPGVVIENHQSTFTNRYYESMFDNAEYLNVSYPPNLTPEEQLEFVTDTAKALTEVATMVARALFVQAGGQESQLTTIQADQLLVTRMLYSFLIKANNSWLQQLISPENDGHLTERPTNFYIGVPQQMSESTYLVNLMLMNLTGTTTNITMENCQSGVEKDDMKKDLYTYAWFQGATSPNSTGRVGFCVQSTVRMSKAVSPAFDLKQYTSKDYSTWAESRWKSINGRIFLVASHDLEMLTLGVGIGVLLSSFFLIYVISSKAEILFNTGREASPATY